MQRCRVCAVLTCARFRRFIDNDLLHTPAAVSRRRRAVMLMLPQPYAAYVPYAVTSPPR
jgi:hypothetical protein